MFIWLVTVAVFSLTTTAGAVVSGVVSAGSVVSDRFRPGTPEVVSSGGAGSFFIQPVNRVAVIAVARIRLSGFLRLY